jgi:formylglycine-generating enzyme required for sulfatase activity
MAKKWIRMVGLLLCLLPASACGPAQSATSVSAQDGMLQVYVAAGPFEMGDTVDAALVECQKVATDCKRDYFIDEAPPHTVTLDAFWIDRTEVTNVMYARCVAAGKCQPPPVTKSNTRPVYYGNPVFDNYPVVYVTWGAAQAYCAWAGRRLPTEAEWEKAAGWDETAHKKRIFPWGDTAPDSTRLNFNSPAGDTTEVGHYPTGASPYGALDMAGNVLEWVADRYDPTYYAQSPDRNPSGPPTGNYRVLRSGAWFSYGDDVRAANRNGNVPTFQLDAIGFRCARSS